MLENTWPRSGFISFRPRLLSILTAIALLLVVEVFHVWLRIEVTQSEYTVSRLEKEIRQQQYEQKSLTVKVTQLTNPRNIAKIATNRLGLRAPNSDQVITVR